jgi:hypothetical protein
MLANAAQLAEERWGGRSHHRHSPEPAANSDRHAPRASFTISASSASSGATDAPISSRA